MVFSSEEIRGAMLDILAGREKGYTSPYQYLGLKREVAAVLSRRIAAPREYGREPHLNHQDGELFREAFWDLFRQGVIMIGADELNNAFPFFAVTSHGRRVLDGADPYFFYDVDSYEKRIRKEIPDIDEVTLNYLKEAMQAFRSGCILSCSVMLGVATEHTFLLMLETIEQNPAHALTYKPVSSVWQILTKVNKFKAILDANTTLPREIKEDLDVHFSGILSVIRVYRNQSGHPTGQIISREQAFVLLQLFIPYCKKIYQLREYFN